MLMTKRYLVVGINDYTGFDPSGNKNLVSCVDDATTIEEMLVSAFGFDSAKTSATKSLRRSNNDERVKDGDSVSAKLLKKARLRFGSSQDLATQVAGLKNRKQYKLTAVHKNRT